MSALAAEQGLAWVGASVQMIRDRWDDHGSNSTLLDLTGEHCIPPTADHHALLELLRGARSDVHYLLEVIDRLTPPVAGDVYVEDDADDTPTIWLHQSDEPDRPLALLNADGWDANRAGVDLLWQHIVRGLPTSPPAPTE